MSTEFFAQAVVNKKVKTGGFHTKKLTLPLVLFCLLNTAAFAADPFTLTSSNFKDNTLMDRKHAGNTAGNPNCIGQNVSPELKWANARADAKSLVMSDWEGQRGLGSRHLLAYNIKPAVTGFAEGELSKASAKFTGGKETSGTTAYRGPCTPPNTGIHHYIFTIIATDLEPGALPLGLTRDELWEKLKGHAKGVAGLVGLFGRL